MLATHANSEKTCSTYHLGEESSGVCTATESYGIVSDLSSQRPWSSDCFILSQGQLLLLPLNDPQNIPKEIDIIASTIIPHQKLISRHNMLAKARPNRLVLGLLVPRLDSADARLARQRARLDVRADARLVVAEDVRVLLVQHAVDLQDVAVARRALELVARAVEAEDERLLRREDLAFFRAPGGRGGVVACLAVCVLSGGLLDAVAAVFLRPVDARARVGASGGAGLIVAVDGEAVEVAEEASRPALFGVHGGGQEIPDVSCVQICICVTVLSHLLIARNPIRNQESRRSFGC